MIRKTIGIGTKVFHAYFGIGTFMGSETKEGRYKGFAFVEFKNYPGISVISPKRLTEIEEGI